MEFRPFSYRNIEEFKNDISENRLDIPLSLNTEYLSRKVKIGGFTLANSLAINPMEGCDGKYDGSLTNLRSEDMNGFPEAGPH